ncbi:MAG: AzlD domain-containing protein [Desulfovibrionaceae bacterium]|nr:AzlD domain-containing protein [Desulfovibrionaceae bacterium]
MMTSLTSPASLVLLVAICAAVTILPRVLPLYIFSKETPHWLRLWLDFVPAAVMAALVAPDLFFYGGSFSINPLTNLYLLAGAATIVFCIAFRNFVATIVFGMAFVAAMRYFGLGV